MAGTSVSEIYRTVHAVAAAGSYDFHEAMGTQEMRRRRVAVLYTHALFGQGIAHLLQMDERLKVTCLRADLAGTTEQLKRLRPHAIVIEGCDEGPLLRGIGRDLAPALFIEVHFEDNLMDIYRGRQMVTASPETLVEAIHHGHSRMRPEGGSLREG